MVAVQLVDQVDWGLLVTPLPLAVLPVGTGPASTFCQ